eukprot:gnl/MRDRNA2_/MRDRNA2_108200_c0_seq1.p1 gnl/MRDRNA2_/MRDRNA2_108200_c0~~gnl/MRDRNA2_/MRDRNA2_108200_c0_seq1.p1  ORF type:complete len:410 (+),score=53.73 gnl/MRDRNA2_/MRDRNA2_108200_c0_seq1:242-1471(+)
MHSGGMGLFLFGILVASLWSDCLSESVGERKAVSPDTQVDKMVDKVFNRVLKLWSFRHAKLETVALGQNPYPLTIRRSPPGTFRPQSLESFMHASPVVRSISMSSKRLSQASHDVVSIGSPMLKSHASLGYDKRKSEAPLSHAGSAKNTMADLSVREPMSHSENLHGEEDTHLPIAKVLYRQFNPTTYMLSLLMFTIFQPQAALAKAGAYGIWEGRIVSLAHPVVMAILYAMSLNSIITGFQWRELRELNIKISNLKAERRALQEKADAASDEGLSSAATQEATALGTKIDEMTETRKGLVKNDVRSQHYKVSSLILGLGTAFAVEGVWNTFLRTDQLAPGTANFNHSVLGAGIVVAWALAAALVPWMQKGNNWARYAHIAFNVLALTLFTLELPTGLYITLVVLDDTK